MSDWRQSESGKSKKRQPKLKSPKPVGSVPSSPKPTGGWRGKKGGTKSSPVVPAGAKRSWTGAAPGTEAASASALRRWIALVFLLVSACLLTGYFIVVVFYQPRKLPLFVISVGDHDTSPELLENPFGNFQRGQFKTVNPTNISAVASTQNNNDNALATLNSDRWIERFDSINSDTVAAGGPDRKVVAFYISSFAAFTPDDRLVIYPQGTSPFQGAKGPGGLKLEDALTSLAQRVEKNAFAWVVLDLQLPPVIANLGDLDPQWRTATEAALSLVDENLRKRLLVTLPGDDGEQNWLAPEYSSSFFGYFYRQLLEGRYSKTTAIKPDLTIGQFSELLDGRVANEVSNRRYASQKPVWLPEENLKRAARVRLVTVGDQKDESWPELKVEASQFGSIDDLWQKLDSECNEAYRWDPLGYAKIESQLLALEEVALNQPASFSKAKLLVEKAINELNRPAIGLGVSLTEDAGRERYFHGTFVPKLTEIERLAEQFARNLTNNASDEQLPSFWRQPVPEGAEDKLAPAADAGLAPKEKPFFVWHLYLAGAQTNNAVAWNALFQKERLQAAVDYAGGSGWLEVFLLQRLADDIDWSVAKRSRPQACAKAILLFDRLQQLATRPEPEISWWLRNDEEGLLSVEQQFLRGLDRLLASQTDEASLVFDQVAVRLKPLETMADKLGGAIATTHEALHTAPHLLAWLLKENQFASELDRAALQIHLRELGQLVQLTSDIYPYLTRRPGGRLDDGMIAASDAMKQKLSALLSAFNQYVDSKTNRKETGAASVNAQTFRRGRIALLSPLISLDARRQLHENIVPFLELELNAKLDEVKQQTPPQRSSKLACDEFFLKQIETQRARWASIAKADPRFAIEGRFGGSQVPVADDPLEFRSELLNLEYWQRAGAVAFGHSPSLHVRLASANRADNLEGERWPWSCPWQRWNLSVANERLFQVERLSTAMWGNGPYNQNSQPEDFYFHRLCSKIKLPRGFTILKPANEFASGFESAMKSTADSAARKIVSLEPRFGSETQTVPPSGVRRAPMSVRGESINAIAQVFLGTPESRLPWLKSKPEERTWIADLSKPAEQSQTFDASYWNKSRPPVGSMIVRGNVHSAQIPWKVEEYSQPAVELTLSREPADGAVIRVLPPNEPPPVTILLLVDCSNSMGTQVESSDEGGQKSEIKLFNLVKKNVIGVLKRLEQIHSDGEANVKIGLIPFGLDPPEVSDELKDFLFFWPKKNFFAPKVVKQLTPDWSDQLRDLISEELKPSGDTPLYDAIVLACEQAKSSEKTLIYVFSDGVNHVNETSEFQAFAKSVDDVEAAVKGNPKLRLSIFHFDFFPEWIKTVREEKQAAWREVFKDGQTELENLRNKLSVEQYGYYRSGQASELMRDSLNSIPRSSIRVTTLESSRKEFDSGLQPIGGKVLVPQESLPASLEVAVTDNGKSNSASIEVEALGGEQILIQYDSRGRLVLETFNTQIAPLPYQQVGGNLNSKLYVRTIYNRIDTDNELGFELYFWNGSRESFTRRPRFVVAEVATSSDPGLATYVLADHRFTPATLFPEARVSDVPWPGGSRQPARLRVWVADTLPKSLKQELLQPQDAATVQIGKATMDYSHKGDRLVAEVTYASAPQAEDRVVLICPDFESANRKFKRDTNSETHEFVLLPDSQNKAAQLQWTTIGQLEEAAEAGDVTQCNFEEIKFSL